MAGTTRPIVVVGPNAREVADLLRKRLAELDAGVCDIEVAAEDASPDHKDALVFAPGRHDTPEFAVEKIVDALAELDLVRLDAGALSPDEEEQIRARLQGLGYLE